MIRVIVCIKQVLDPEAPSSSFKVDIEAKRVIPPKGTPPVLNPFDENALEAAIKIKKTQESKITILSMGKGLSKALLRKALAAGGDELILLEDNSFEDLDSYSSASILASAIRKLGTYDLILCGRMAADTDAGQVGSVIAELLEIPCVVVASKIEVGDKKVKVERLVSDGSEVVEAMLPALVTVSSEVGELRSPAIAEIMGAQKKPITVWTAQDLTTGVTPLRRTKLNALFQPVHEGKCEMVTENSAEEAAGSLAVKLREAKIL